MKEHRYLIESQASITQFAEILRTQEVAISTLEHQREDELRRRRDFVYSWLSAAKSDVDQETHTKIRQSCVGTGQWLMKVDRFHSWFDPDFCSNQLLWLTGIPGAGKTILASLVVEEAQKLPGVTIAFFYCRYEDTERNTFLAVARGILAQLLRQDDNLLTFVYDKASRSGQTHLATNGLAKELLEVATRNYQKLYVILDGIDECEREERREIASVMKGLWDSLPRHEIDTFRCLFISQDDSIARKDFADMVSLKVTESHIQHDIRTYASSWTSKIRVKFDLAPERQKYIEDVMTEKAEGMFLFARLMGSYLYSLTSIRRLNEELSPVTFPQGPSRLDEIYARIARRVLGDSSMPQSDSRKLLSWLVCAKRPIKWQEIQCAVSINLDEQTVDWEGGRYRVDSKDLCGALVEVDLDNTVRLVHHTAKRYLVDKRLVDVAAVELSFALLCVGYLSFPCFEANIVVEDIEQYISLGYYGFMDYAYAYWSRHLDRSLSTDSKQDEARELAEAVAIFVEMYWIEPGPKVSVPKSLLERMKPLEKLQNYDRIACAVYVARRQLYNITRASSEEQVLSLSSVLMRIRAALEDHASSRSDPKSFELIYGVWIFKCPRPNCVRFYNGFASRPQRDDHVPKHERSYFCSFPGCPISILGCATSKELQKHDSDFHEAFNLEDQDAEYPEMPPEQISFDCDLCGAIFTRKHNLKNHIRLKHSGPNVESFLCSSCGKRFARQGDRTRHETTSHSMGKKFVCGGSLDGMQWGCGREFNRGDVLNRHWKSEKGRACIIVKQHQEASESSTPNATPVAYTTPASNH